MPGALPPRESTTFVTGFSLGRFVPGAEVGPSVVVATLAIAGQVRSGGDYCR